MILTKITKAESERLRSRRIHLIKDGLCVSCGKNKIFKNALCRLHYETVRVQKSKHYFKNRERYIAGVLDRRDRLVKAGLCRDCGIEEIYKADRCNEHYKRYLVDKSKYRKRHPRSAGDRWMKLRRVILAEEPICMICRRAASAEVDHILPLSKGGTDCRDNLQGVCKECHNEKTKKDRRQEWQKI